MKPRGTILKRIRFSSKNIIVFRVKYKIKAAEDSFDLFFYESFIISPNYTLSAERNTPSYS